MTTKSKKTKSNIRNIARGPTIGEFAYPRILVTTRFGYLELRPYSKTRACIQTTSSGHGTKSPLEVNKVEYDGQLVFTNGRDEQDKFKGYDGAEDRWPSDAGDWSFRYKSGHFNFSRTDWLSNPNTKYNSISDAARRTLYDLAPEIMAEALRLFPTLLEETEVARAKDLQDRIEREASQKHAEWQKAADEADTAATDLVKAEAALDYATNASRRASAREAKK